MLMRASMRVIREVNGNGNKEKAHNKKKDN